MAPHLDLDFVRGQFPAFGDPTLDRWVHFENAGGSYPCRQTIDALDSFYREVKVQPHHPFPVALEAGRRMDDSRARWASALGVGIDECHFGPSTSANTYVLAHAFRELLGPDDVVVVTDQDHEANSGVFRRAAETAGAVLREWHIDPTSGLLDPADLDRLLDDAVAFVTFPHASNIVGAHNDVAAICARVRAVGATSIVDGVSAVPHGIPDVGALGADIYLFSLYKVFSVHQGLMTVRRPVLDRLPNQGHVFNDGEVHKRLNPTGPDHAQVAAAAGVLDYVDATAVHHGVAPADVAQLWAEHERQLLGPLLDHLSNRDDVRLIGPADPAISCPTVAFLPARRSPADVVAALREHRIMAGAGAFYSHRTLRALGIDPASGVVRVSFVHYTSADDVEQLIRALDAAIGQDRG